MHLSAALRMASKVQCPQTPGVMLGSSAVHLALSLKAQEGRWLMESLWVEFKGKWGEEAADHAAFFSMSLDKLGSRFIGE